MYFLPPITQSLLIVNVVIFFAEYALNGSVTSALALWPLAGPFMPWQLLTYAFIHANLPHLIFNMFGLSMFGSDLERVWGPRRYLNYYLVCAVSAALMQLGVSSFSGAYYPTVGASGAIFGLLLAFAKAFPHRIVTPLFPPIPMTAPVFVAVYGGLELVLGVTGTQAGVAHFAHLGGLLGGFLYLRYARRSRFK